MRKTIIRIFKNKSNISQWYHLEIKGGIFSALKHLPTGPVATAAIVSTFLQLTLLRLSIRRL